MDEDDRLTPILDHLSKNFATPSSFAGADESSGLSGVAVTAASIDSLSSHFPLCMRNLHLTLRRTNHLKHYGRLQYTLFLKGIGLSLEDCLTFWRTGFKKITDETFNKEYRYNVRHAYGDVGGDVNRRGRGYSPFSCQKILTEHPPGPGESHGCPYRHFSPDNLFALLHHSGMIPSSSSSSSSSTRHGHGGHDLVRLIKDDLVAKRYHIACNRVFEANHAHQIKAVKDDGTWSAANLDTIVHPNTYFKRSVDLATLTSARHGTTAGPGAAGAMETD